MFKYYFDTIDSNFKTNEDIPFTSKSNEYFLKKKKVGRF